MPVHFYVEFWSWISCVRLSGTACTKHRPVSQLASQLHAAIMILFLRQQEHATLVTSLEEAAACNAHATILDSVLYIQSCRPSLTKFSLKMQCKSTEPFKENPLVREQLNTLKSNMLGKNIFLWVIRYLTYPSTTDRSNFAEHIST